VIARTRKLTLLAAALILPGLVLAGFVTLYPVTPQVVLASPDTIILRLESAGDSTALTPFPAATANWDCVDDVTSDGDSTYVYSASNQFASDLYNLANTSQTGGINSVTVWVKVRGTRAANNVAKTLVKTNGVIYEGAGQDVTTGYSDISRIYDENPQTNAAWTWDEVNLLQAGCALKRAGPTDTTRCTQVWVVVDYTPAQDEYTLTINIVGNGSVAKSPDQATYHYGDAVQLAATANPGWTFDSWSGDLTSSTNPDTVTMDGDKMVTATFTQDEYTLTINIVGNGSVAESPDQATYHYGDTVQLAASADPGWTFDSWSGDLTSSTNPDTVTMDGDKTVTATFTLYAHGWGAGVTQLLSPPPVSTSPTALQLQVNMCGNIILVQVAENGVLMETVTTTSPDGSVTLTLAEATQVLSPDGDPLVELTVEIVLDPPGAAEGYHVIAAFDFGPDGTTFSPSMEIGIRYNPDALPEGVDESNLVIAYYDEAAREWVFVTGEVNTDANTITFSAGHFTTFAILAAAPAPKVTPPPTPSSSDEEGGLSGGVWAGIGIVIIALVGMPVWLILRRFS